MARANPKARYDQITMLGIAKKATTADECSKLRLMRIPFHPVASCLGLIKPTEAAPPSVVFRGWETMRSTS
jgi:hypothetical protein